MNDWYNDPPETPEPPECCGDYMDVHEDGSCSCTTCGKKIEPANDGCDQPMPEPEEPYPSLDDLNPPEPKLCPHGHEPAECNACMIASDLAYDAARESRWR